MKHTHNILPSDAKSLYGYGLTLRPHAPYVFNEGQLSLRVIQERSMHVLTLAQDDGVPLTLSLSRGAKEPGQSLQATLQQQLEAVAEDAQNFQQRPVQGLQVFQSPLMNGWRPSCLFTEVTYQLAELSVHQGVGVIQLSAHYLLFVTLTHPHGFTDETRREWQRILSSFVSRGAALPEPGGDLFGADEDDGEGFQ